MELVLQQDFSGQAGIGNYIAASKGTVLNVGTAATTSGTSGANDAMGAFNYTTVGLAAGTIIGGIRWTTYFEDVRGTGNASTNFTSSLLDFTITGSISTVLPVSWGGFSGYRSGTANRLQWVTVSEQNNLGFEVQRSTDGLNYTAIGFVNTRANQGNSNEIIHYNYFDANPAGTKQHYRLSQIDIDNHLRYSNIIQIRGERPSMPAISGIFPNPSSNWVNLNIDMPEPDNVLFSVIDISGRLIMQKSVSTGTGSNTVQLDISGLHTGIYIVTLKCSNGSEALAGKFVKL
ncbi:MAG: T9SS type A sorting domain-containing protein [Chitinophagaceae bacterium]|nr:T9SS type A sorting domain-containing protein [Chitinophagaceae bacterium]